ncbi:acyltransferase domain-containing protein [Streptomyces sp. NPDC001513]|uniref:acyltransferase domain-containing protein n=1 Tax=Streptomyces sp. NPDC001513 TaxID=3364580 RepID=UPI0036A708EA
MVIRSTLRPRPPLPRASSGPASGRTGSACFRTDRTTGTVAGTVPSHSPAVEPLRDRLVAQAANLRPRRARLPLYSTVTGARVDGTELTARHWYENARRPVLPAPAIRRLVRAGVHRFVEPSPHPLPTVPVEEAARAAGARPETAVTGTLRRRHSVAAHRPADG